MSALLVVVLVVRVLALPGLPGIVAGAYQTEAECKAAGLALDRSTSIAISYRCEVRT